MGRTSEGGCASLERHAVDAWNGTPPGSYRRLERHVITAEREGEGGRGGEGGALAEESRPACSSLG